MICVHYLSGTNWCFDHYINPLGQTDDAASCVLIFWIKVHTDTVVMLPKISVIRPLSLIIPPPLNVDAEICIHYFSATYWCCDCYIYLFSWTSMLWSVYFTSQLYTDAVMYLLSFSAKHWCCDTYSWLISYTRDVRNELLISIWRLQISS